MAVGSRSSPRARRSQAVRVAATCTAAVLLVLLGLALPWPHSSAAVESVSVQPATPSVRYNWTSYSASSPSYLFPNSTATTIFAPTGTTGNSSLTLVVGAWLDSSNSWGIIGGLDLLVSGSIDSNLRPSSASLVLVPWSNNTLVVYPIAFPLPTWQNTSNVYSAWSNQDAAHGPWVVSLDVNLENVTDRGASGGTYNFSFGLMAQLEFRLSQSSKEMTFTAYAILQDLSPEVYAAQTITLADVVV